METFSREGEWQPAQPGIVKRTLNGERMTYICYRFESRATFPLHQHPQEQLCLLEEGSVTCRVASEETELTRETALLIPENVPHSITAGPEGALLSCILSPKRTAETDYQLVGASS